MLAPIAAPSCCCIAPPLRASLPFKPAHPNARAPAAPRAAGEGAGGGGAVHGRAQGAVLLAGRRAAGRPGPAQGAGGSLAGQKDAREGRRPLSGGRGHWPGKRMEWWGSPYRMACIRYPAGSNMWSGSALQLFGHQASTGVKPRWAGPAKYLGVPAPAKSTTSMHTCGLCAPLHLQASTGLPALYEASNPALPGNLLALSSCSRRPMQRTCS